MSARNTALRAHVMGSKTAGWMKFASVALIATLTLSACSSDDDGDDTASSSSESSSASSSASATSSESASSSEETTSSAAERTVDSDTTVIASATADAAANDQAATTGADQAAGGQNNAQGGQAAAVPTVNQDEIAIRSMVMGINQATTLRQYMEYLARNTCSRVVNNSGGWQSFDFNTLDEVTRAQLDEPVGDTRVDNVTDIVVNGTTATGNIVSTVNGATSSEPMTFEYEGNAWTFCQQY